MHYPIVDEQIKPPTINIQQFSKPSWMKLQNGFEKTLSDVQILEQ
jgi:hypothetical protein